MQLQISYDFTNLSKALDVAEKTAQFADILEIGTPLLLVEGINAIESFKAAFPEKAILADAKIVDRVTETIPILAKAGATYITVLYGTSNKVIQKAVSIAHEHRAKIVLDLIDAETMGQAARDAETLNVDHILFHYPHEMDELYSHLDQWESVRGNTSLPIFVSGRISKERLAEITKLKPQGIVVGEAITMAVNPKKAAEEFKNSISS